MCTILLLSVLNILTDAETKVITATSFTSTHAMYQSAGIVYQNGIITCPSLFGCNIYCNSAQYACGNIVIDASAATSLRLICETHPSTCQNINIIKAPSTVAYISCSSERACHGSEFYLDGINNFTFDSNAIGAASEITIYAQYTASSATISLNCNTIGSCNGGLYIFAPNPNNKGDATVHLNCNVDGACGNNTQLGIPSIFWDQLQLTCGTGGTLCDQVKFQCLDSFLPDIGDRLSIFPQHNGYLTYNNNGSVLCTQFNDHGCCPVSMKGGPTYTPNPTGTSTIIFNCTGNTYQCASAVLDFTAFETVTVYCNEAFSCYGMVLYGPKNGTNPSLKVQCAGNRACYAAYIDSRYSTNTTIVCLGNYACSYQTIYYGKPYGDHLCLRGDSVCAYSHYIGKDLLDMQMQCGTSVGVISTHTTGNCQHIWGDFPNSAVSIICDGPHDCYDSFWTLSQSTAIIECIGIGACYKFNVLAYDAIFTDIACDGESACMDAYLQCPSTVQDSCKINCDGGDYACKGMNFYAENNWISQYLDLTCVTKNIVLDKYTEICDSIEIYCKFDDGASMTNLSCNSKGVVTCDPNNMECCPFTTSSSVPVPVTSAIANSTYLTDSVSTTQNNGNDSEILVLILKEGDICIDGYKDASNDAYCEPCGVNEAGRFGSCDECGNGKHANVDHTECVLCDDNFIGVNGYCDIDCAQSNKITNELHTECINTEKEYWYATAEFDAVVSGIGVLTGFSCIGAFVYAFCKKKLCCAKANDTKDTKDAMDKNNEIKNLNTPNHTNQHIQTVLSV